MTGAVPPPPTLSTTGATLWDELATLAADERGERTLLHRLLEGWAAAQAVPAAALYLQGARGWRRELTVGSHSFPASPPKPPHAGLAVLALPGGAVVYQPGPTNPQPPADPSAGALVPLLATAVQNALLRQQLKHQHFQVNYRVVELEALYDVGLAIASTLELDQLSEEILLRAVSLLDARRGALYLLDGADYRLERTIGGDGRPSFAADDSCLTQLLGERGDEAVAAVLPGATHLLAVPIEIDGKPRGLLVVGDKESREGVGPFTENDRRTLSLFANQAAMALENARLHLQALEKERLEREMQLAAEIQRGILPKGAPLLAGWELIGWNRPARQVGGDYYDFRQLGDGKLGVTVGDVTGKGMAAALMVSILHSALRLLRDRIELGPDLLASLNQHILESSTPNKFITLLLAQLDPASGTLGYVNAGHNPGLLVHPDRTVTQLGAGGVPLGLISGALYRAGEVNVGPGDLLCLYSDGITEAYSPDDEEFGEERLVNLLRAHGGQSLPSVLSGVDEAVTAFAAGRPQGDDQTVVMLRRAS